jgi:uncharacterized lipoprotein YajG
MTDATFLFIARLFKVSLGVSVILSSLIFLSGCSAKTENKQATQTPPVAETNTAVAAPTPVPAAPKGLDPRTDDGVAAILRGKDFLKEEVPPEDKYKILDALVLFQQANPHIPIAEYGNPRAATTLWFLTQAALEVSAAKAK